MQFKQSTNKKTMYTQLEDLTNNMQFTQFTISTKSENVIVEYLLVAYGGILCTN